MTNNVSTNLQNRAAIPVYFLSSLCIDVQLVCGWLLGAVTDSAEVLSSATSSRPVFHISFPATLAILL